MVLCQSSFETEAVNLIFQELQQVQIAEQYSSVQFEGTPKEIRIFYGLSGCSMCQNQVYPTVLWVDLCLVMRLLGRIAHSEGWPKLVTCGEGMGFHSSRWSIYPTEICSTPLPILARLLERVDQTMLLLDSPLDLHTA